MIPFSGVSLSSARGHSETIQSMPCLSSLGTGKPLISTGSLCASLTSMKPMSFSLHKLRMNVDLPIQEDPKSSVEGPFLLSQDYPIGYPIDAAIFSCLIYLLRSIFHFLVSIFCLPTSKIRPIWPFDLTAFECSSSRN